MKLDAGIVLSHFYHPLTGFSGRQKKRMDKGIELLEKGKVKYLLTTGGRGFFNMSAKPFGKLAADYLVKKGVDKDKILTEGKSINTLQNAEFSFELMKEKKLKSAVVITSADHMPRSKKIFKEVFPQGYQLEFVVSDHLAGLWTVWDVLWHTGAWVKYFLRKIF